MCTNESIVHSSLTVVPYRYAFVQDDDAEATPAYESHSGVFLCLKGHIIWYACRFAPVVRCVHAQFNFMVNRSHRICTIVYSCGFRSLHR